jgi:hypothetical protein
MCRLLEKPAGGMMRDFMLTRRAVMLGTLTTPLAAALPRAIAQDAPDLERLKPGQFIWSPERAAFGPVVVLVSFPINGSRSIAMER